MTAARTISIQVNGKIRCKVQIAESQPDIQIPLIAKAVALIEPRVAEAIAGREIARVVYVASIANIVTA